MTASSENLEQGTNWSKWIDESQRARDERELQDIARELEGQEAAGYTYVSRENVDHLVKALGRLAGPKEVKVFSSSEALTLLSEDLEVYRTMDTLANENEELLEENEKARGLSGLLGEAVKALKVVPGYEELVKRLSEAEALLQKGSTKE